MKKTAEIRRPMERNKDLQTAYLVNISQGKDAGVLFRSNYSIHQHIGIGYDTSSCLIVGTSILLRYTVPIMCAAALSFGQQVDGWIT